MVNAFLSTPPYHRQHPDLHLIITSSIQSIDNFDQLNNQSSIIDRTLQLRVLIDHTFSGNIPKPGAPNRPNYLRRHGRRNKDQYI